jgi:Family of unknown function (DUF5519)
MPHAAELVDELANELDTWPGVRIVNAGPDEARVLYEQIEFGILRRESAVAELHVSHPEHEELIDEEIAEPDDDDPASNWVKHTVEGPSDVTRVLELFGSRYRDLTGDDEPFSSQDPGFDDSRF